MADYTYTEYPDELCHYGVLGMKWGVKKNRAGTIDKAYNKLGKLDISVEKKTKKATKAAIKTGTGVSKKYAKLKMKNDKAQSKADKKKYGFFSNAEKAAELQAKADKALYKANKYKARAEKRANVAAQTEAAKKKAVYKAEKWSKKMRKYIGETKVSELNSEQLRLAKKYLGM